MAMKPSFIIIYGDPISGLSFVGPFDSNIEATDWADQTALGADWWISPIMLPQDLDTGPEA